MSNFRAAAGLRFKKWQPLRFSPRNGAISDRYGYHEWCASFVLTFALDSIRNLARLAVALSAQGQGIGAGLLRDAIRRTVLISEHAGIRAMLTHPIDESAVRFYKRFGFVASPVGDLQLLLLLKDAKRWVAG